MYRLEGVLAILRVMARGDIELLVAYVGGDYLLVTIFLLNLAEELLKTVTQGGTLGKPEGKTGAHVGRESEKLHLFAELAVVALLGFLEQDKILIKHLLFRECYPVNTHQLVALLVAAPVCSGERHDFAGLYHSCRRKMRATAEVCERALGVCSDRAILKFRDKLTFVFLLTFAKHL